MKNKKLRELYFIMYEKNVKIVLLIITRGTE